MSIYGRSHSENLTFDLGERVGEKEHGKSEVGERDHRTSRHR